MPVGEGWDLPAEEQPWSDFHWFQIAVGESRLFCVLSDQPIWYTGHYYLGRMRPCCSEHCTICAEGVGTQVRYCFPVVDLDTKHVGLLELGRGHGLDIRAAAEEGHGLKGLIMEARKTGKASQSRTKLTFLHREPPDWINQIDPPDCGLALYLTWSKAGMAIPDPMQRAFERRKQLRKEKSRA